MRQGNSKQHMEGLIFVSPIFPESDCPDRTLQLRRVEFEKRRMRRELRRRKQHRLRDGGEEEEEAGGWERITRSRRLGGSEESLRFEPRLSAEVASAARQTCWPFIEGPPSDRNFSDRPYLQHGDHRQTYHHNNISAFFPLDRRDSGNNQNMMTSSRGDNDRLHNPHHHSEDDNSSYPSLPPPPPPQHSPPPPCPSTPSHRAAGGGRYGSLRQPVDRGEGFRVQKEEEEWADRVPRLDLEDIWSDATLPSSQGGGVDAYNAAADLSLASTQQCRSPIGSRRSSNLPPPPQTMRSDRGRHFNSAAAVVDGEQGRISTPIVGGFSSVRSVGCDTGDLGSTRTTRTDYRWGENMSLNWGGGGGGGGGDEGDGLPAAVAESQTSRSYRRPSPPRLGVGGGGGGALDTTEEPMIRRAYSVDQMAEISSILRYTEANPVW